MGQALAICTNSLLEWETKSDTKAIDANFPHHKICLDLSKGLSIMMVSYSLDQSERRKFMGWRPKYPDWSGAHTVDRFLSFPLSANSCKTQGAPSSVHMKSKFPRRNFLANAGAPQGFVLTLLITWIPRKNRNVALEPEVCT